MAYQQQQQEEPPSSYYCDHERPPPSLAIDSSESSRPSWNGVMDIDSSDQKLYDCTLSSLKKKPRRSVSFQPRSTLYCYDVPEDEPQDWYTDEDEEIFKAEARKEIAVFRRMKGGGFASDPQHNRNLCIVGIEQHLVSSEFSKKRARTKKLVKYAVLDEQSKIDTGCGDKAERIAESARRYSEWSAAQAKMFGDFQYIQSKEESR
jgi:hypothetical protein